MTRKRVRVKVNEEIEEVEAVESQSVVVVEEVDTDVGEVEVSLPIALM